MKKGLSKNGFTLVVVLSLLIVVVAYMMGYKKYSNEAALKEASNATLATEVESLKVFYINEAQYKAEMVPMAEGIRAVMEKYPAATQEEDVIMLAVYTQMSTPVRYENINIGAVEHVKVVAENVVKATNQENMQEQIVFKAQQGTYVNQLTYSSLKETIKAIFDSNYNIGINNITYTKNQEKKVLAGSIDLTFYSMEGNGKEYTLPNITPYLSGTGNIFGFIDVPMYDEDGNLIEEGDENIVQMDNMLFEVETITVE